MRNILVTNVAPKRPPGKGGFPEGTLFMEPQEFTDSDTVKGAIFLCMPEGRQGREEKLISGQNLQGFAVNYYGMRLCPTPPPRSHKSSVKSVQMDFYVSE